MAAFSRPRRQKGSWLVGCSLLMVVAAVGLGWLLWQAVALSSLEAVGQRVTEAKPLLSALRLGLIALVATLWPWVSARVGKTWPGPLPATASNHLRWRVVVWLLVIELVIGQNLPGRLIATLGVVS
ncbi:hypothetical protein CWI75_08090 [Kineobactrum sediminis]|uniref:Uncharacterized protein n=1 Tax=Kineobactrum sediminis TaxID=1905677 RepID=A0A2N5Y4M0_9GAMM|nr:hypothetical protein [Kineobactrum sediminis]PLW83346.1 hypothetical protein CWI75_08090 [Kineobactrum sediminis]